VFDGVNKATSSGCKVGELCAGDGQEVTTDDTEIVSALRTALADRVGKERFELWFGASTQFVLGDGTLTIGTPNRFFQGWLRTTFRGHIESACMATLGRCPTLEFQVDSALPEPPLGKSQVPEHSVASDASKRKLRVVTAEDPSQRPTDPNGSNGFARRRFASFSSFVVGQSNRVARASAEMVTEHPGQFSPLLIHGPTSIGKTHLLEAIWTSAKRRRPAITAVYLSAEQFTTFYVAALRGSGLPSFRRKYRGVEMLIIDDLQFFRGKRSTLVELLYTIDTLLRARRQLVFAADRPPAELSELGLELTTRLEGGMVCSIEPPDHATRLGIVDEMARRMKLKVPRDVQQFIASQLRSHSRELSGALCRLEATSNALGRPITPGMAEDALAEMIHHSGRVVRLPDIQKAVCEVFGLDAGSLQSGRKVKCVSHPRMLAMWLARKHTRAALTEIGHFFGRRSHSTVISAQRRVDGWIAAGTPVELAEHTCKVDDAIRQVERMLQAG